jgi:hypothetical protein
LGFGCHLACGHPSYRIEASYESHATAPHTSDTPQVAVPRTSRDTRTNTLSEKERSGDTGRRSFRVAGPLQSPPIAEGRGPVGESVRTKKTRSGCARVRTDACAESACVRAHVYVVRKRQISSYIFCLGTHGHKPLTPVIPSSRYSAHRPGHISHGPMLHTFSLAGGRVCSMGHRWHFHSLCTHLSACMQPSIDAPISRPRFRPSAIACTLCGVSMPVFWFLRVGSSYHTSSVETKKSFRSLLRSAQVDIRNFCGPARLKVVMARGFVYACPRLGCDLPAS